ncbi:MAG: hypothetical protein EOO88_00305 [Pedobacter sp.]|nr:MAG: hypothetical protein EOO88_00305 [Pedobacter sp.]
MENRDLNNKDHKGQSETSPYQELYGKKEGENAANGKTAEKQIDGAGDFGSAANAPGPESKEPASDQGKSDGGSE